MSSFSTGLTLPIGSEALSVDTGDFNNDTFPDIVAVGFPDAMGNTNVSVLLGDGGGGFSAPTTFLVGAGNMWSIRAGDFDGDGILDLSVANVAANAMSILTGASTPGTGLVGPAGDFSTLVQNPDSTFTRTLKNGTRIEFDASGLQTAVIDRNGNTTSYAYDGQGRLTTITDPMGLVTTLAYAGDRLASVTDPAMRTTSFVHDGDGNLTSITDPDLSLRQFAYDGRHRLKTNTSKRNFATSYDYDFAGRHVQSNLPDISTRKYTASQVVGVIDTTGGDGTEGNPAPYTRPAEVLASFTDGNGNTTTFTLNRFGGATQSIDALGRTTDTVRNADSLPTSITQAVGTPDARTTSFTYDAKGNQLTRTEDSIAATTTLTYDPSFSQVTAITDAKNNPPTTITLDVNANPIEVIDAAGTKTALVYGDANCPGLVTSVTTAQLLPEESTTSFAYDPPTCNLVSITDPVGNVTTLAYDGKGNVIAATEAAGAPEERTTRFVYDDMNRVVTNIDATNTLPAPTCGTAGVTCFTYDAAGNLQDVTDGNGSVTGFSYDQIDRVDGRTDPLLSTESFAYDGQGNLRFATDRKGQTIELQYDAANRLSAKIMQPSTPDEAVRDIGFDLVDNIRTVVDPDSSLTMTYDGAGRLDSATTTGAPFQPAVTVSYTYDLNGNRLTMDDGVLGITDYVPDALDRLTSITAPGQAAITFGYDALSRRRTVTRPNGVNSTLLYDPASRLTSIVHGALSSFGYGHDTLSNRNSLSQTRAALTVAPSLSFVYDAIDQVTSATHPLPANPVETFDYDAVGNRLSRDGQAVDSVFNTANRLLEDDDFTYTYDANGNLETRTAKVGGAVTAYTYDAENRLVRIDFPDLTVADYRYDGLGRRIEKNVNGVITRYVYDGMDILLEYDGTNALLARYTHGPAIDDPLVMERDLDASGTFEATERFAYHTDGSGSVTELTDSTGVVARAYAYDSYGQIVDEVGTLANPFAYTAREFDAESGLYFYRARYYDPETGRFISEDPLGFAAGDANLFRYVFNNPVNFTDPSGLVLDIFVDIGFIVYDAGKIIEENIIGNCGNLDENLLALGADVVGAFIPFATGLGVGVRAGAAAAKKLAEIKGFTRHGIDRVIERGVKPQDILDAVKNPIKKGPIKVDGMGRPSQRVIGKKAIVVVNPKTKKVITVIRKESKKIR